MMAVRALATGALISIAAVAAPPPAAAESYPAHPVRLVVPFAAAGPTEVIARIVAQKLTDAWGQQVYTENIPGAGGNEPHVVRIDTAMVEQNLIAIGSELGRFG